ncbi:MAG: prephenate/arogenate dehydrogenase, partial [Prochlorotrichaceae cyanobacterium]
MRIGIVGLGLIGGSLGFDFRAQGHFVIGMSRQPHTCDRSVALGSVDEAGVQLQRLADCEVIFLCTPLNVLVKTALALKPYLPETTIVTDVGSAKATIVEALEPHFPQFIGGHPMAGKAERGIEVAQTGLFTGNPYVLTPTANSSPRAIDILRDLIHQLQSRYYTCSPTQHDRAVAWISHLPVMVSASLIQSCGQDLDPTVIELAQNLASSGFRDTSRVGGGVPELGRLMAEYNTSALLQSLQTYRQVLDGLIEHIEGQ